MEVILSYIPYVVLLVLIGGAVAYAINQRNSVQEWLLLAVTEAEKALGGGTGKLKLRQVYQQFVTTFGLFAKFVKFETFELWVSGSLEQMKKLLESNKKVEEYVKGDDNG